METSSSPSPDPDPAPAEGTREPTKLQKTLAKVCCNCPVCVQARKNPNGFCNWLVRTVEVHVCPMCKAYEKVYGKPAYGETPDKAERPS